MLWFYSILIVLITLFSLVSVVNGSEEWYDDFNELDLFSKICRIWCWVLLSILVIGVFALLVWGVHEIIVTEIYHGDV